MHGEGPACGQHAEGAPLLLSSKTFSCTSSRPQTTCLTLRVPEFDS